MDIYAYYEDKSRYALNDDLDRIETLQNRVTPIDKGGTGGDTARAARRALGLNFDVGDVITGTFYGAGYVTSGGRLFVFEIPLSKVIDGNLSLINIAVSIRQNGYYLFGSGADGAADVANIASLAKINGGIRVSLNPDTAPEHTVNNEVFAVICTVRINVV